MSRPLTVTLSGDKLKKALKTFDVLDGMVNEKNTSLTITQEEIFPGDKKKWEIFYDLLFPEEAYKFTKGDKLFVFGKNNVIKVNPKRSTKEEVLGIMNYMSGMKEGSAKNYLREVARMQPNAPGVAINKPKKAFTYRYRYGGKRVNRKTRKNRMTRRR